MLQTGALPVSFEQIERTDVSATLGKDSLQQAKKAAIIGLLVVAIFLIIFYRLLGLVAVTGLAIYVAFMYAAILLLNVTLTLPGFAGLILTIGVAADANVVIFERIKEEVRAGKSTRAAIATGYQKGFHTIVDANVVTAITALVLFAVATAQVKGFALMLLIGTVVSVLTAVVATRAMLGLLAGFRWFDNPRFMGAEGQGIKKWMRIDVNSRGRRRIWLSIATVAIVLSVVAVCGQGTQLRHRLQGRHADHVQDGRARCALATCAARLAAIGRGDAVVQGRGESPGGDRYTSFQVRTKSLTECRSRTRSPGGAREQHRRHVVERQERLVELQPADRARGDPRGDRLLRPDHALHLAALPMALRGTDSPYPLQRHPHHARRLRPERT